MNRKPRLLIIEDEPAIREGLIDVFVYHGFEVDGVGDGREGLRKALSGRHDLILLDLMLPGVDGFEICSRVRAEDPDQAIIMLTARTADEDIIQGLALGADDYVAKPFSVTQLVLRARAVLRRAGIGTRTIVRLSDGTEIDTCNLCLNRNGEIQRFTRREMQVLVYLADHAERPVSREELLNKVWGYDRQLELETRTVDIHIAKLRRKLEPDPGVPSHLVTVRGAGYRLLTE